MKLSGTHFRQLLEIAIAAGKRAGDHIQSEAGRPREVMVKPDGHTRASQVVTEVDFASERMILESLAGSMQEFELGLLTEESDDDASRHERDYFWCIDPIDGTLPFTENVPGYSVSIGLVSKAGEPVLGVVVDPVTGNVYSAARGLGVFKNGGPLALSDGGELTLVIDRTTPEVEGYEAVLDRLHARASGLKIIKHGGAVMNACWVIEHAPAIYFKIPKPQRGGGALWDFAATACLFSELEGAVVTDFAGEPLRLNREGDPFMNLEGVVYASSEELALAVRG